MSGITMFIYNHILFSNNVNYTCVNFNRIVILCAVTIYENNVYNNLSYNFLSR